MKWKIEEAGKEGFGDSSDAGKNRPMFNRQKAINIETGKATDGSEFHQGLHDKDEDDSPVKKDNIHDIRQRIKSRQRDGMDEQGEA